jgi:hypothetical protein
MLVVNGDNDVIIYTFNSSMSMSGNRHDQCINHSEFAYD